MDFKTLLNKFRTRKNLSKSALAKTLGVSTTYLRNLENQGSTPPRFTLCQSLADLFTLTEAERHDFYLAAFEERLSENRDFFNFLSTYKKSLPDQIIHQDAEAVSKCTYLIKWRTLESRCVLDLETRETLAMILKALCFDHQLPLHGLDIQADTVSITLDIPPKLSIKPFIKGLQSQCEAQLKQQVESLRSLPNLWEDRYQLFTLGHAPAVYEKGERAFMTPGNTSYELRTS